MKFSRAYIEAYLLAARSPEEMFAYYTEKIIANGDRFSNISTDIGATVDRMVSTFNSTDKSKTFDFKKLRYDFLEKPIGDVVTRIVDYLQKNNLLKYLEFILFKATDKRLPEDLENIIENLKVFDELRKSPIQNFQKDIQRYNSFTELQQALEPYKDEVNKQKLLMNQEYVDKHQKSEGATTVLEEGPYKVIKITKADASADLCRNTGWCVKDPKYFEHYNIDASNPLYLISKNGYKYALIHFGTNQFKDANDTPASEEMGAELYPIIKKLTDNIPFTGDFDVLLEISEFKSTIYKLPIKAIDKFGDNGDKLLELISQRYKANSRYDYDDLTEEIVKIENEKQEVHRTIDTAIKYVGKSPELESRLFTFINSSKGLGNLNFASDFVTHYENSVRDEFDYLLEENGITDEEYKKLYSSLLEIIRGMEKAISQKRKELSGVPV